MKIIAIVGDKEFETFDAPDNAQISDVLMITVTNKDLKKITLLRFVQVKKDQETIYYDLDTAFSLGEEHIESVKRVSFGEE